MHRRARGDSATGLASRTIAVAVPDKGNYCVHELAESKNPRAPLGNPQPGCQQERAAYKPRLSITLGCRRRGARAAARRGHDERNDETIETQRLSEDENQNHTDEELGLLRRCPHTRVTNDADRHTRSQTRETTGQTGPQVAEGPEESVLWHRHSSAATRGLLDASSHHNGNDEAVDTNHTSHNHGNDGLHDELGVHDTHGADAHAGLGSAVGSAKVCNTQA
jgi:hypothetical protein